MNVSSVTNHFATANKGFITTLGSTISAGAVTVPLTSVSGLTNGTVFVGIIEPGLANEQEFTGTVDTAGVQITGVKWTDGTNVDHTAGVTIVDYVAATDKNMLTKGILVHADQDGTLKAGAVDNAAVLASDVVTTAKILDSNVTSAKLATGVPVQLVASTSGAVATGTTTIPFDDTIPQITEGNEYMTLSFTPKSATNRLFIEVKAQVSNSVLNNMIGALFQDSTANALAANEMTLSAAGYTVPLYVTHDMVAGTTSAITFRFRAGGSLAGTTTFNGEAGGRKLGGITLSTFKVTEYKA